MRIVTLPGDGETAAELFEEVWREDFGAVSESPTLRDFTFAFQWRARLREFEVPSSLRGAEGTQVLNRVLRVEMSRLWAPTRESARAHVRDAIVRVMSQDLPPGSPLRGASTAIGYSDDATVYRLMAVTPSGATRACLSGDARACLATLGMGFGGAADDLPGWFTPEQRREMVFAADMFQRGRDGVGGWTPRVNGDDPLVRRCVEADDASACDQLLSTLEWVSSVPTSSDIRGHFFWYAVRTGGEGAWARALERAEAPIPELLEHVSGLPLEELATLWRSRLIESRPDVHAGLGATQLTVLVWALIFAALAMRSTRWRLG